MSQFVPLRSSSPKRGPQTRGERTFQQVDAPQPMWEPEILSGLANVETSARSTQEMMSHGVESRQIVPISSVNVQSVSLHDVRTTQSLVSDLQSHLDSRLVRRPLVIPAEHKRRPRLTDELLQQSLQQRHLSKKVRFGTVMTATVTFLFLTLFSFLPLGNTNSDNFFVNGVIQLWQSQPLNWSLAIGRQPPASEDKTEQPPQKSNSDIKNSGDYRAIARDAALQYGIDPYLFERQIEKESGFNPNVVSWAGAIGIAQFMPGTAAMMGIDPWDPVASLYASARHMSELSAMYGGDYRKALAAYNAGPGNVNNAIELGGDNWLAFTPAETQNYVVHIYGW